MDELSVIVGMMLAVSCVALGYFIGIEHARLANQTPPTSRRKRDDDPADWWKNGGSPEDY